MTLEEQDDKLPLAFRSKSSAPDSQPDKRRIRLHWAALSPTRSPCHSTKYNKIYNWYNKVGKLSIQFNSFTTNGKTFGVGTCLRRYRTRVRSSGSTTTRRCSAESGQGPRPTGRSSSRTSRCCTVMEMSRLAYAQGNPTAYQPVHTLYTIANEFVPAVQQDNFVFHIGKPSIDVAGFVKAATVFQDWAKDGYFSRATRASPTLRLSASSRLEKRDSSSKDRGTPEPSSRASGTTRDSGFQRW